MTRVGRLAALLLGALAALLLAPPAYAQSGQDERILSFLSDVTVRKDGDLDVAETIRIRSAGDVFRHGLLREFPTRYERDGRTIRVGFDVASVERDGHEEPYRSESMDNGVRLKIGSADTLLTNGEHSYTIRYRTSHQLGFFGDYDELYWNATGTGWRVPIDMAEARIRLPAAAAFGKRAVYTGSQGSTEHDAAVVEERPGDILFRTTAPLDSYQGLTVAVAWPKGVVDAPIPPTAAQQWLAKNGPLWAAGLALLALCGFYFHAWRKAGRGPLPGTVVPLFSPPENMSAAALRYVRRMGYDNRAFAAAIVDSGVHGKLRLVEEKGGFFSRGKTRIDKTGDGADMAPPERDMLRKLFSGGDSIKMENEHHTTFALAQAALKEGLQNAYLDKTFHLNKGWAWAGLLLVGGAMLLVGLVIALTDPFAADGAWGAPALGLALVAGALVAGTRSRLARSGGSWLVGLIGLGFAAGALFMLFTTVIVSADAGDAMSVLKMFAPLLALPLALSAFSWMAAPTKEGRKLMDEIAGFEKYLSVTEENRLETLHPPEKTPELFERYLPHAIALGVENRWASRFEGVLAAASADPGQQQNMGWYVGNQNVWSDPGRFASSMGSALTSSIASASTAPGSSSGSGGGGSSGGGGGGGGGGGW
ncbi:MAG: DUF2207 domain-containing protein [Alphaproteobacteria bacterium]|nr:MAG: DUF2207 domain-containing protein [Alphaproteobacteria bacterium]